MLSFVLTWRFKLSLAAASLFPLIAESSFFSALPVDFAFFSEASLVFSFSSDAAVKCDPGLAL
jgi:hypothetical protein